MTSGSELVRNEADNFPDKLASRCDHKGQESNNEGTIPIVESDGSAKPEIAGMVDPWPGVN